MKVEELICALDYIEDNLAGEMRVQEIADYCYVSLSALQKTFKYAFHLSINEYIIRRRFSCAAKDLLESDNTILDIALKYGYSNAESFTRGFKKVWNMAPKDYRKTRKFAGHTPKLSLPVFESDMEDRRMSGVKYDLTWVYDVLQERRNNAYVCADLSHLMEINDKLGIAAGDEALLELMRRVEEACNEDDVFLRIGGDEFVVITNSKEMDHANEIVKQVSEKNGQTVTCGELEFPVSVHIGAFINPEIKNVNTAKLFGEFVNHIMEMK